MRTSRLSYPMEHGHDSARWKRETGKSLRVPLLFLCLTLLSMGLSACSPRLDSSNPIERTDAVESLTDQSAVFGVAKSDDFWYIRVAAVQRLLDLSATPGSLDTVGWPIFEALSACADVPTEHRLRISVHVADLVAALRNSQVQSLFGEFRVDVAWESSSQAYTSSDRPWDSTTLQGENVTITAWTPPPRVQAQFSWASDFGQFAYSNRDGELGFQYADIDVSELLSTLFVDLSQAELMDLARNENTNVRTASARLVTDQ